MTWIVESPAQSGYVFVFSPVAAGGNNQPIVTPPNDITLQFANGGAGLSKSNAQLLAWIATASCTDIEDGALAVTADLSGLPDPIQSGVYDIAFTSAQDASGLTGSATAQLTVSEAVAVNDPPVSSGNYTSQSAVVGSVFSFNANVNFSDTDALTYSATGLPAGLTVNSSTGVVSGTPTAAGGYTATITATDTVGQTATASLPIVVSAAPSNIVLFPIKRTVVWDEGQTPNLIIGDAFWHLATLMQGVTSSAFNVASADSISVALVSSNNTARYTEQVELSSGTAGANWGAGILSVLMPGAVTQGAAAFITAPEVAKLEIQVVIDGNEFTWFAPVNVIPGFVE